MDNHRSQLDVRCRVCVEERETRGALTKLQRTWSLKFCRCLAWVRQDDASRHPMKLCSACSISIMGRCWLPCASHPWKDRRLWTCTATHMGCYYTSEQPICMSHISRSHTVVTMTIYLKSNSLSCFVCCVFPLCCLLACTVSAAFAYTNRPYA